MRLDDREVASLIAALRDDDPEARERASARLRKAAATIVPALEIAARDGDGEVRERARALLAEARSAVDVSIEAQTAAAMLAFGANERARRWIVRRLSDGDLAAGDLAMMTLALTEELGLGWRGAEEDARIAVARLAARQRESGAWGEDDPAATTWAVLALKSAEAAELPANAQHVSRGVAWLREHAAARNDERSSVAYLSVAWLVRGVDEDGRVMDDVPFHVRRVESLSPSESEPSTLYLSRLGLRRASHDPWARSVSGEVARRKVRRGCETGSVGGPGNRVWNTAMGTLASQRWGR